MHDSTMSDMSASKRDTQIATSRVASMSWTPRDMAERLASQMSEYRTQLGRRVVGFREANRPRTWKVDR